MWRLLLAAALTVVVSLLGEPARGQPAPASTHMPVPPPTSTPSAAATTMPPTPRPTPTPSPTPVPPPPPATIQVALYAFGSGYGVYLAGDPIELVWDGMHASPYVMFSYIDGGARENLELRVTNHRGELIKPAQPVSSASGPAVTGSGLSYGVLSLSSWGYHISTPGTYYVAYRPSAVTRRWAAVNGFQIRTGPKAAIRIVQRFSDIDPHLFPAPSGWSSGVCLADIGYATSRSPSGMQSPFDQGLLRGKRFRDGDQCFRVIYRAGAVDSGYDQEQRRATGPGASLLSETSSACGRERKTTINYDLGGASATHIEAVLLQMATGYLVARYERPAAAPDDSDALEALDAPCKLL